VRVRACVRVRARMRVRGACVCVCVCYYSLGVHVSLCFCVAAAVLLLCWVAAMLGRFSTRAGSSARKARAWTTSSRSRAGASPTPACPTGTFATRKSALTTFGRASFQMCACVYARVCACVCVCVGGGGEQSSAACHTRGTHLTLGNSQEEGYVHPRSFFQHLPACLLTTVHCGRACAWTHMHTRTRTHTHTAGRHGRSWTRRTCAVGSPSRPRSPAGAPAVG